MSPGWRSAAPLQPGRQPDPTHPGGAAAGQTALSQAEWEWRRAERLVDTPGGVEVMLNCHWLRPGVRHCVQCGPGVFWPCESWLVATLARMRHAGTPPRRKKRITWPRRGKQISWFEARSARPPGPTAAPRWFPTWLPQPHRAYFPELEVLDPSA